MINQDYEKEKLSVRARKAHYIFLILVDVFIVAQENQLNQEKFLFQFITPFSTSLNWNWKSSEVLNKPFWKNNELSELQKKNCWNELKK